MCIKLSSEGSLVRCLGLFWSAGGEYICQNCVLLFSICNASAWRNSYWYCDMTGSSERFAPLNAWLAQRTYLYFGLFERTVTAWLPMQMCCMEGKSQISWEWVNWVRRREGYDMKEYNTMQLCSPTCSDCCFLIPASSCPMMPSSRTQCQKHEREKTQQMRVLKSSSIDTSQAVSIQPVSFYMAIPESAKVGNSRDYLL